MLGVMHMIITSTTQKPQNDATVSLSRCTRPRFWVKPCYVDGDYYVVNFRQKSFDHTQQMFFNSSVTSISEIFASLLFLNVVYLKSFWQTGGEKSTAAFETFLRCTKPTNSSSFENYCSTSQWIGKSDICDVHRPIQNNARFDKHCKAREKRAFLGA